MDDLRMFFRVMALVWVFERDIGFGAGRLLGFGWGLTGVQWRLTAQGGGTGCLPKGVRVCFASWSFSSETLTFLSIRRSDH